MKASEFKIPISVESYEEETAENHRNCYVATTVFTPLMILAWKYEYHYYKYENYPLK